MKFLNNPFSAALIVPALVLTVSLSGCKDTPPAATKTEQICARAAYAVSQNIGNAKGFVISTAQYIEMDKGDGNFYRVVLDCAIQGSNNDYIKHVYLIGEGDAFLKSLGDDIHYIEDGKTGLYLADFGDYKLEEDKSLEVSTANIQKYFEYYANKKEIPPVG